MKIRKSEMPLRSFKETFVSDNYATETLINGNTSECISYLKDLLECGNSGIQTVYDELNSVKENCPNRYEFVKTAIMAVPSYTDLKHF